MSFHGLLKYSVCEHLQHRFTCFFSKIGLIRTIVFMEGISDLCLSHPAQLILMEKMTVCNDSFFWLTSYSAYQMTAFLLCLGIHLWKAIYCVPVYKSFCCLYCFNNNWWKITWRQGKLVIAHQVNFIGVFMKHKVIWWTSKTGRFWNATYNLKRNH